MQIIGPGNCLKDGRNGENPGGDNIRKESNVHGPSPREWRETWGYGKRTSQGGGEDPCREALSRTFSHARRTKPGG